MRKTRKETSYKSQHEIQGDLKNYSFMSLGVSVDPEVHVSKEAKKIQPHNHVVFNLYSNSHFLFYFKVKPNKKKNNSTHLSLLVPDSSVEVFALYTDKVITRVYDPTFGSNGSGCVNVITSHHSYCDACALTLADGLGHLEGKTGFY